MRKRSICLIGLGNLPALAREFNHLPIGGAQVQQTLLAHALAQRGYQVSMVVGDYGQADGQAWDGVTTYKAYDPKAGLPVFRFIHPRWTGLCAAIRRANPDICYFSCASAEVGQVVLCEGRKRRMIFWVASDADCDPDKLLIRYARDKKLYEYGLRRVDAIIAQSLQQQAALRRHYGVDSTVAASLVDIPSREMELAARDIPVLWVSNVYPLKRPELLIDLAKQLPEFAFEMIGGPISPFFPFFEEMREQAGACANLRFRGHVPFHDVHEAFQRARVFVNTSDIEGFPNTYLQAWASGTPVVTFFDPDGVVAREGLGRTVGSMDEMRQAVREIVSAPDLWREMSSRCRRYMLREHGEDRVLAPYLDVIERLGERARSAEPGEH